jgi:hypothetical protein
VSDAVLAAPDSNSAVQTLESRVRGHALGAEAREASGLAALVPGMPITFQFQWRSRRFVASLQGQSDGSSRLAVTTHVEKAKRAGSLITVIATDPDCTTAQAKLVEQGSVLFAETFPVPRGNVTSSVDGLLAQLTTVVLLAAPYLDFLSEQTG